MGAMLKMMDGQWVGALCPFLDVSEWCCDDRCVFLMRVAETDKFVCSRSLTMNDDGYKRYGLNLNINFLKRSVGDVEHRCL